MKKTNFQNLTLALLIAVVPLITISLGSEGVPPIADAGLPRYAAQDPVVLDGTGSYDPGNSGTLSFTWRQISGPSVIIIDANTATPTVAESMQRGKGRDTMLKPVGFTQTDEIQECVFELVVSDGELTSQPDSVRVVIVRDFAANELILQNEFFDSNKPTFIFFGGGDCISGGGSVGSMDWIERANVISFPYYEPDPNYTPGKVDAPRTYYRCGDMIIAYLSSAAPYYKQPIQTCGWSTGGQPAVDVGIHLNTTYADARYAVNRVTLLDARACRDHSDSIRQFLESSVDGEQCWLDNHRGNTDGPFYSWPSFYPNVMRVGSSLSHSGVISWYANSLTDSDMNQFNHGVVGGAYWSVLGAGKNLQLASTPETLTYTFEWHGDESSGYMNFYDEAQYPSKLPEPVTLVGPPDGAYVDANGVVFSCEESENAVGYQLLFGINPFRVMDYLVISDTPSPPSEVITSFPYDQTWWTIKVYDAFGSTIYADPVCFFPEKLEAPKAGLIAHWKLDETEGIVAHDSARTYDANLVGDPVWQPDGGMIDGALAFDGIDDYVKTPFILNPRLEPFSMFVWIKADINKVHNIISQKGMTNMLYTNFEGKLITSSWASDLRKFIISQEQITPGQWHQVGLMWDGLIKSIYLDGVEVAQTMVTDESSEYFSYDTEFHIGASWSVQTDFFSGLIDDVRLYNRALIP